MDPHDVGGEDSKIWLPANVAEMNAIRDEIAASMWHDYTRNAECIPYNFL